MDVLLAGEDDRTRLKKWLPLLGGDGFRGRAARDRAVGEMRTAGADRLFPLLREMLADPDVVTRCKACQAVLWIDPGRGAELVLPLLHDGDSTVRWNTCGLLHDFGGEWGVKPLIERLKNDPDPQVRTEAAYVLGGVGSPQAIPALLEALDNDHEEDFHGFTPSHCAATALDDILGTEETRIRVSSSIRRLPDRKPDLGRLKEQALAVYQDWCAGNYRVAKLLGAMHAVLVHIPLSDGDLGDSQERQAAYELDDALFDAVESAGAGESLSHDYAWGEAVFFLYGPDADNLFAAIEPALRASSFARKGYAIKRYGGPGARELRIDL